MTARQERPRVLLVDDYAPILSALERLLRDDFDVVGRAVTEADMWEAVWVTCPNVVIMDLWLPGVDAIELCLQLRRMHPQVTIILMSASDDAYVQRAAMIAGAAGFISKVDVGERLPAMIRDLSSHAADRC